VRGVVTFTFPGTRRLIHPGPPPLPMSAAVQA
jgi:hypothetical protein